MSNYYHFNEEKKYYEAGCMHPAKHYMYDPVTDSYVEDIDSMMKQELLHKKYGRSAFAEFYQVLNELLQEEFHNVEQRIISCGDYIFEAVIELTDGRSKLRYSPYAMLLMADSAEEALEGFEVLCKQLFWADEVSDVEPK